jgi:hypothetical protein
MEQREATKNDVVDLLGQWENKQVRVYIFSRGVGVNYWGYLELAYDTNKWNQYRPSPTKPVPSIISLCRTPKKGVVQTEIPMVVINLDEFKSFQILEANSSQLAVLENEEAQIRVLLERG